jgi:hypothetical protein
MQHINHQQLRGQQQHKLQQFNIPKTPEQLFIKNKDINHPDIPVKVSLKTVKYIDELYTKQFLDEYFTI